MSEQKLGEIADGQGVTIDLDDGDFVSDIVVIAKISRADGGTNIGIGSTIGMDWITQLGIITAAKSIVDHGYEGDE